MTRGVRAALALLALAACGGGAPHAVSPTSAPRPAGVRFVEDDAARAEAEAKKTGKLLFVDAWAPWCHSCLSMRAFVLADPKLAALDDRFVWLALDTEKEQNAAFVRRHPNQVYPTLWLLDPRKDEVVLEWPGTATADELVELLRAAASGREGARAEAGFLKANHLAAEGDVASAANAYVALLSELPAASPLLPRVVEAAVSALSSTDEPARCAEIAASRGPGLPPGTSRATVLATGLGCAREAKLATASLAAAASLAANDPDPRVLADDRSALFEELVETKRAAKDEAGAKEIAGAWARFLEGEAARAKTPEARAVFDAHRVGAYLALGDPARAIPMLEQSAKDFPEDYNPPARLGRVYLELGRLEEARQAAARATAKVYGPRALRVLALAADVAKAGKDVAVERAALEEALRRTAAVPLSKGQRKHRDTLEARLRALP